MSLDGKIGTGKKGGRRISSTEGMEFGQHLRLRADAVLVGIGTILSDNPRLTYRGNGAKRRPLLKVVLDSDLRIPPDARIFQDTHHTPVLIFSKKGLPKSRREIIEASGGEVISIPTIDRVLDIKAVLKELAKRDILGLLVEGGSRVHWSFVSRRLVDCFCFIIAPMILGGADAIPCVGGKGYGATADAPRFRIRKSFSVGPDTVIEGYPSYSRSIISPWRLQETAAFGGPDPDASLMRK